MNTMIKYIVVAFLSLTSGIAFAYPLFYMGYVEPLNHMPNGPKPQIGLDIVYANFGLQPYNSNTPIPEWYNESYDGRTSVGQPNFLTFDIVTNITNYSNRTALISQLSFCVGNSSNIFNWTRSIVNGSVEGLWLDGKWMNVTWIPQKDVVPAHWREGVDIERTFVMGNLTEVWMNVNGSWVDVTNRVTLLEKDTIMPMSNLTMMTDIIARGEIRFFNPSSWQPDTDMPQYSVANINLTDGFDNRWLPGQSRLIMLKGILPISLQSTQDIIERLNSNLTLVRVQAFNQFEDTYFNGVEHSTSQITTVIDPITLGTALDNSRVYNKVLAENQMFELDSFQTEAFIKPRS
jgi:hypothetical protein